MKIKSKIMATYLVHLIECDFVVLPLFAQLDYEDPSAKLIAIGQYVQYVLLKNVLLLARLQVIVHVGVLDFEAVVVFYELERRLGVILARAQEPYEPGLVVQGTFQISFTCISSK